MGRRVKRANLGHVIVALVGVGFAAKAWAGPFNVLPVAKQPDAKHEVVQPSEQPTPKIVAPTLAEVAAKSCFKSNVPYPVWDFPPVLRQHNSGAQTSSEFAAPPLELWKSCGHEPETLSVLRTLSDDDLLGIATFDAALEMNRRGVANLENKRDYEAIASAIRLFSKAANQGHPEAYSNLAFAHFAFSNLEQSAKAAEVAALLNQPEAMGLLAYFKVEAIHVERNLPQAWSLVQRAKAAGADVKSMEALDLSYQFFPTHWKQLQQALKDKGFFKGAVNGIFAADSKDALRAFQRSETLEETNNLTLSLLSELDLLEGFNASIEAQQYIYGTY